MRATFCLLIALVVSGCTSTYDTKSFNPPDEQLRSGVSAYVTLAADGSYGDIEYPASGRSLTNETAAALAVYLTQVKTAKSIETREEALASARSIGAAYVFQPTILHWEDRATEWSGRLDRVSVKVTVWDADTGAELSSAVLDGASKLASFGGDHPQDLLPQMLSEFAGQIFSQNK